MFLTWDPSRLPWLLPGSELENVSRQGKHCLKQEDSTMLVTSLCNWWSPSLGMWRHVINQAPAYFLSAVGVMN